jgi:uncharacterized protein Yka (UPF0111/DUF47 family)
MISFQRLLGREDEFFSLLEASAQECLHSVTALRRVLAQPGVPPVLDDFIAARRKDKEITAELEELLIRTEDLEALADRLYKIPKTIEKFAERFALVAPQIADVDFSPQAALLDEAVTLVVQLVKALHAADFPGINELQTQIQAVEARADDVLNESLRPLYAPGFPGLKAIILKDLFDLIEKAIDRCRDAGNVVSRILLKNT